MGARRSKFAIKWFSTWVLFEARLQRIAYNIGWTVATYPWKTLAICGTILALCGATIPFTYTEEREFDVLWVNPDSFFLESKNFIIDNWGEDAAQDPPKFMMILMSNENAGFELGGNVEELASVFSEENLQDIATIEAEITARAISEGRLIGSPHSLGNYVVRSPADFWPSNITGDEDELVAQSYTPDLLTRYDEPLIRSDVFSSAPVKEPFDEDGNPGPLPGIAEEDDYVYSVAGRLTWLIFPPEDEENDSFAEWFSEYTVPDGSSVYIVTQRMETDFPDEIDRSWEPPPLTIAQVVISETLFVLLTFTNFRHLGRSKWISGLGGLMTSGSSLIITGAICFGLGLPYSQMTVIVVVLVTSIGVDDMFLIADAAERADPLMAVEDRMGEALADSGVSILFTTLTDCIAFALGAFAPLKGIADLCIFAAISVAADFGMQITAYVAIAAIAARRHQTKSFDDFNSQKLDYKAIEARGKEGLTSAQLFFKNAFVPFVLSNPMKIVVMVAFTAATILSTLSLPLISRGFWFEDILYPSEVVTYSLFDRELFSGLPEPAAQIAFRDDLDYSDPDVQRGIVELMSGLEDKGLATPGSVRSWVESLLDYARSPISGPIIADGEYLDETTYPVAFAAWSGLPQYQGYLTDLVLDEDNAITASRVWYNLAVGSGAWKRRNFPVENLDELIAYINGVNDDAEAPTGRIAFQSFLLALDETLLTVYEDISVTLAQMMAVVILFSCIFLVHPGTAVLVTVAVMMTTVDVFGVFYLLGFPLNTISATCIVIGVGLTIDYIAHVARGYMSAPGDRQDKVAHSLVHHGSSVGKGLTSTLVGMTFLSFGPAEVFRTFGLTIIAVQLVGIAHAFLFLPVVLSVLGPTGNFNPVAQALVNQGHAEPRAAGTHSLLNLRDVTSDYVSKVTAQDVDRVEDANAALMTTIRGYRSQKPGAKLADVVKTMYASGAMNDITEGETLESVAEPAYDSVKLPDSAVGKKVKGGLFRRLISKRASTAGPTAPKPMSQAELYASAVSDYRFVSMARDKGLADEGNAGGVENEFNFESVSAKRVAKPSGVATGGAGGSVGSRGSGRKTTGSRRQAGGGSTGSARKSPGRGSRGSKRGSSGAGGSGRKSPGRRGSKRLSSSGGGSGRKPSGGSGRKSPGRRS